MICLFRKVKIEEQLREERGRNLELQNENIKQGIELSEREIKEMIMGTQISDLEIMILGGNL